MRQPARLEVFVSCVSGVHLLFCGGGPGIILSVPLASELPAQQQAKHSQILSLSPPSHLGNHNLYLQTVGAGEEHEISNRTSRPLPSSLPPSLPAWPACPLTSCPPPLFISEMCAGCASSVLLQNVSRCRCRCGCLPLTGAQCLHSRHRHVS